MLTAKAGMDVSLRSLFAPIGLRPTRVSANGRQNGGTKDISDRPATRDLVRDGEQRSDTVSCSECPCEERDVKEGHNRYLDGEEPAER